MGMRGVVAAAIHFSCLAGILVWDEGKPRFGFEKHIPQEGSQTVLEDGIEHEGPLLHNQIRDGRVAKKSL